MEWHLSGVLSAPFLGVSRSQEYLGHPCGLCAVHVLPVGDIYHHVETGTRCHCRPRAEKVDGGFDLMYPYPTLVIFHNSYDYREWETLGA